MIHQKEFYFIRHGQTDLNVPDIIAEYNDAPLNATGRKQAEAIEPLISSLPIQSVCYSPLTRAKETKEAITVNLQVSQYEVVELTECSRQIWMDMIAAGESAYKRGPEPVKIFMQTVLTGLNRCLAEPGPVLIVAHGGIHWSICCFMNIVEHDWIIDNCQPVHFHPINQRQWKATKLAKSISIDN